MGVYIYLWLELARSEGMDPPSTGSLFDHLHNDFHASFRSFIPSNQK